MTARMKKGDRLLLLLVLLNAVCIAGFVGGGLGSVDEQHGGWRPVDLPALMNKIRSGDLVDHEADFYRPAPEGVTAAPQPQESGP